MIHFGLNNCLDLQSGFLYAQTLTDLHITFLGDELFSDTYRIALKDEVIYEVFGKVSLGYQRFLGHQPLSNGDAV